MLKGSSVRAAQLSSPTLSRRSSTRAHGWARPTRWRPGPRRPRSWPQSSVRPSSLAAQPCTPHAYAEAQSMASQCGPGAWTLPGSQLDTELILNCALRHARRSPARFAAPRLRPSTKPELASRELSGTLCRADLRMAAPACAGVDAERLFRVLRAAVQLGVFAVAAAPRGGRAGAAPRAPRFRNNRLSAVLREDHPNCIKDIVRRPAEGARPMVSCCELQPSRLQAARSCAHLAELPELPHVANRITPVAMRNTWRQCPAVHVRALNACAHTLPDRQRLCTGCPCVWRRGACSLRRQPCLTRGRPPCRSATWPRTTSRPGARARARSRPHARPPAGMGLRAERGQADSFCPMRWAPRDFCGRRYSLTRGSPLSPGRRRHAALRPDKPWRGSG